MMKFTAVFLLCTLLVISFAETVKPVRAVAKQDPCKKVCSKRKAKDGDGCSGQGCSPLLNCSVCGFLTVEPLGIIPGAVLFKPKPVSHYKTDKLSAYHKADWKPPKAC